MLAYGEICAVILKNMSVKENPYVAEDASVVGMFAAPGDCFASLPASGTSYEWNNRLEQTVRQERHVL